MVAVDGKPPNVGELAQAIMTGDAAYVAALYGNPLACGGTLTPSTMGVAHRTMPCGAKLQLRHGGNTVAVRVVDRGPFAGNSEFDLTAATREALGFGDVGTVLTSK